jgi:hypothetical protein
MKVMAKKMNVMRLAILTSFLMVCGATGAAVSSADTASRHPVVTNKKASRYAAGAMPESARWHYADVYGVDQVSAKLVESGALVRFSYRVVDAAKAQVLQDKTAAPLLIDAVANVSLVIPTLEKVGPLRQSMPVENGKSYWMAFSNKGSPVKRGHKVSVVVGPVRIDGMVVQ